MKNSYLKNTGKTIFDESIFQEFIVRCVGETNTPAMEKTLRVDKKRKSGKKYSYKYEPEMDMNKTNEKFYKFKNSSGNEIRNTKNYKINLSGITNDNDEDDNDT